MTALEPSSANPGVIPEEGIVRMLGSNFMSPVPGSLPLQAKILVILPLNMASAMDLDSLSHVYGPGKVNAERDAFELPARLSVTWMSSSIMDATTVFVCTCLAKKCYVMLSN